MALAKEDVEQIQAIVLQTINNTPEFKNANVRYEIDLRERTIRVEEELKHQRELMQEGFKQMEKRFEQIDKRFEQVEKRFEQMSLESDKRFTEMNRRLDRFMFWSLGITVSCALFVVTYLQ
ncbi:hypothetical protein [uncultured Gammaproteobacteria bacterium]|nr:hypothetical protein [uncultured Gammaproteobacteria bacterium]